MSKLLLTEFFELKCDDRGCQDLLNESEKRLIKDGFLVFPAKLQQCDARNGNGRTYPRDVLEREIDNYQKLVEDRRSLGECDHPDDSVINLKNASHMITRIWWNGDDVIGTIKVLRTPSGQILRGLYESGVKFGFSSRALGSLKEAKGDDGNSIQPSAPGAYVLKKSSIPQYGELNLSESQKSINKFFTRGDRINRALNSINLG